MNMLTTYDINPNTAALLPVKHLDYCTLIIETNGSYYINQPSLTLIKEACLKGYSTYEGRREAVRHYTGFHQKVPIPINPYQNIYAFPTQSPHQFECCWLFPTHIQSIKPTSNSKGSIVTFKNKKTITLSQSASTLRKQMQRTAFFTMLLHETRSFQN